MEPVGWGLALDQSWDFASESTEVEEGRRGRVSTGEIVVMDPKIQPGEEVRLGGAQMGSVRTTGSEVPAHTTEELVWRAENRQWQESREPEVGDVEGALGGDRVKEVTIGVGG